MFDIKNDIGKLSSRLFIIMLGYCFSEDYFYPQRESFASVAVGFSLFLPPAEVLART